MPEQPDWWPQVSPLLDEVLELEPAARVTWLAELAAREPAMGARVDELLREHDALVAARFLEQLPALPSAAGTAGAAIGAYRLLSRIGEGGMGSVWLAERVDGELRQQVAVKLLGGAGHRPGWRERFLRERQLLASLSHPAIVRVMDAGHTADGRPYLIMEYVEGRPIDVHAADLPVDERLELFLRVCDGVAHAHRHLIIHRDLKPSNILVDKDGAPKLLDFGIAKLLDDTGDAAQTVERLLTPSYASPEQFAGAAQTTATDVYSLGAVLYRILSGRSPHDQSQSGALGMAAIAGAPDIPAPSTIDPSLPVDLDVIVLMALRRDPEDRYASVEALAADVRRFLEDEPVEALAGDSWYRARKFLRRNRVPIAAAAAVIASLSAGLYYANRQRVIAQRRFKQVRELANRFIALDAELRHLPGSTQARTRIVTQALEYLATLEAEAHGDDDLMLEIASAYMQVARAQGVPTGANLGLYAEAESSQRQAATLVDRVLARNAAHREALLVAAQLHRDAMALHDYQGHRGDASRHAEKAASHLEAFRRHGTCSDAEVSTVSNVYANLGVFYSNCNRLAETIRFAGQAAAIAEGVETARMRRASALGVMSIALRRTGELEEASQAAHEAVRVLEALAAAGDADAIFNFGNALLREALVLGGVDGPNLGRPDEAIALLERSRAMSERQAAADPRDFRSRTNLANCCRDLGDITRTFDPTGALLVYDQGLTRIREAPANARARREEACLLATSSHALRKLGRIREATQRVDEAQRILDELGESGSAGIEPAGERDAYLRARAEQHVAGGQLDAARRVYRELLEGLERATLPDRDLRDAVCIASALNALARVERKAGDEVAAGALDHRRLRLWESWAARQPTNAFVQRQRHSAVPILD